MTEHVMFDFETMGIENDAAVVALGAVKFNPMGDIVDEFYARIDLESAVNAGLTLSASTILWWLRQSDAARAELTDKSLERWPLQQALVAFSEWLIQNRDEDDEFPAPRNTFEMWSNGAKDMAWIESAYKHAGLVVPFHFGDWRDFRTERQRWPQVTVEYGGTAHNALDDARNQALHLAAINRYVAALGESLEPFFTMDELEWARTAALGASTGETIDANTTQSALEAFLGARRERLGLK